MTNEVEAREGWRLEALALLMAHAQHPLRKRNNRRILTHVLRSMKATPRPTSTRVRRWQCRIAEVFWDEPVDTFEALRDAQKRAHALLLAEAPEWDTHAWDDAMSEDIRPY